MEAVRLLEVLDFKEYSFSRCNDAYRLAIECTRLKDYFLKQIMERFIIDIRPSWDYNHPSLEIVVLDKVKNVKENKIA